MRFLAALALALLVMAQVCAFAADRGAVPRSPDRFDAFAASQQCTLHLCGDPLICRPRHRTALRPWD